MSGWFLVISILAMQEGDFTKPVQFAIPFASEQACREFQDRAEPVVDFVEPVVGVFWSCWENPPAFDPPPNT